MRAVVTAAKAKNCYLYLMRAVVTAAKAKNCYLYLMRAVVTAAKAKLYPSVGDITLGTGSSTSMELPPRLRSCVLIASPRGTCHFFCSL